MNRREDIPWQMGSGRGGDWETGRFTIIILDFVLEILDFGFSIAD
jgi:hypothetical protein